MRPGEKQVAEMGEGGDSEVDSCMILESRATDVVLRSFNEGAIVT